jgi:tRNA G37 N-methylase Trm5
MSKKLPPVHEFGNIAVVKKHGITKDIAIKILESRKNYTTVLYKSGKNCIVLAGKNTTIADFRELDCRFKIDLAQSAFSKKNLQEKLRLISESKGKLIADLLPGVGHFVIPIAKKGSPKKVVAISTYLSQVDLKYLKENIKLNRVSNLVEIQKLEKCVEETFDQILLCMPPKDKGPMIITTAIKLIKFGGVLTYYDVCHKELLKLSPTMFGKRLNLPCKRFTNLLKVKDYAPNLVHFRIDLIK